MVVRLDGRDGMGGVAGGRTGNVGEMTGAGLDRGVPSAVDRELGRENCGVGEWMRVGYGVGGPWKLCSRDVDPPRPVTSRTEVGGACETLAVNEGQGLEQVI